MSEGDLQLLAFLVPPWHKSTASILRHHLAFANSFRMALELVVLIESTNIGIHAIRQADLAKLTQSNNTIGGKMMQLYLECFQDLVKEARRREVKAVVYTKIWEEERRNSKLPGLCH